jgi:hypothetical protein
VAYLVKLSHAHATVLNVGRIFGLGTFLQTNASYDCDVREAADACQLAILGKQKKSMSRDLRYVSPDFSCLCLSWFQVAS